MTTANDNHRHTTCKFCSRTSDTVLYQEMLDQCRSLQVLLDRRHPHEPLWNGLLDRLRKQEGRNENES